MQSKMRAHGRGGASLAVGATSTRESEGKRPTLVVRPVAKAKQPENRQEGSYTSIYGNGGGARRFGAMVVTMQGETPKFWSGIAPIAWLLGLGYSWGDEPVPIH
jgi:hypothetical protein